jgi:hypothetical protein
MGADRTFSNEGASLPRGTANFTENLLNKFSCKPFKIIFTDHSRIFRKEEYFSKNIPPSPAGARFSLRFFSTIHKWQ